MTVGELVTALMALDPTGLAVIPGAQGGFAEIAEVRTLGLRLNCNADPSFGPHEVPAEWERPQTQAVALVAETAPARGTAQRISSTIIRAGQEQQNG